MRKLAVVPEWSRDRLRVEARRGKSEAFRTSRGAAPIQGIVFSRARLGSVSAMNRVETQVQGEIETGHRLALTAIFLLSIVSEIVNGDELCITGVAGSSNGSADGGRLTWSV